MIEVEHYCAIRQWSGSKWWRSSAFARQNGKTTQEKIRNVLTLWWRLGERISWESLINLYLQNARNWTPVISRASCKRLLLWIYTYAYEKLQKILGKCLISQKIQKYKDNKENSSIGLTEPQLLNDMYRLQDFLSDLGMTKVGSFGYKLT